MLRIPGRIPPLLDDEQGMPVQVRSDRQHVLPLGILRFLPEELQIVATHIIPFQKGNILQVDSITEKTEPPDVQRFSMRLLVHLRIEERFDLLILECALGLTRRRDGVSLERILRKAHHPLLHRQVINGAQRAEINAHRCLGFFLRQHPDLIGCKQIRCDVLKLQIPPKLYYGVEGRSIGFSGLDPLLCAQLYDVLLKEWLHLLLRKFGASSLVRFGELRSEGIEIELLHAVDDRLLLAQPFIDAVAGVLEIGIAQVLCLHLLIVLFGEPVRRFVVPPLTQIIHGKLDGIGTVPEGSAGIQKDRNVGAAHYQRDKICNKICNTK